MKKSSREPSASDKFKIITAGEEMFALTASKFSSQHDATSKELKQHHPIAAGQNQSKAE